MHEPLRSHLEEILQGRGLSSVRDAVQAHLASCPPCAAELNELQHSAKILRVLRQPEAPELRAGFYARVMQRVEAQGKPSFWYLLLDPVFGRRLVYGTCAAFLLMASFLLATSSSEQPDIAQTPVQIMVQPSTGAETRRPEFGDDIQRDREHFLVTLASFAE